MSVTRKTKTIHNPGQPLPWRCGIGIVLVNERGRIWCGTLAKNPPYENWIQGGIDCMYDKNGNQVYRETPTRARDRELFEEVGLLPQQVTWLGVPAQTSREFSDSTKYQGEQNLWYLGLVNSHTAFTFTNKPAEIVFTHHVWRTPQEALAKAEPRRQPVYRHVWENIGFATLINNRPGIIPPLYRLPAAQPQPRVNG